MYKLLIAVMIVLIADLLHAQNNTINILADVNAGWLKQPEAKQLQQVQLTGATKYQQCIATHLKLVEQILRQRDVTYLSSAQKQNRTHLLDELNGYWKAGVFPVNDYLPYKSPVFIDRKGTHCAVGYLMMQSGHDDLAQTIDHNEKFAYVHEIKTAGVAAWANKYGFTIDELAWIQPSYMPATKFSEINGGPNGAVDFLNNDYYDKLLIAGRFDSLNNLPCLGIGYYRDEQLECLGGGVSGTIAGLSYYKNKVAVCGAIQHNNITYPIALFDTVWHYINIPGRDGATAVCSNYGGLYNFTEVAINNTAQNGLHEVWQLDYYGNWAQKVKMHGLVKSIHIDDRYAVYGGAFDSVTITDAGQTVAAHNVIVYDRIQRNWFSIPNAVSDTVSVVKTVGATIYIGGVCSDDSGRSNICLSRYLNGVMQPLMYYYPVFPHYNNHSEVLTMTEYESGLLLGGEFEWDGYTRGKNLFLHDATTGEVGSYGFMNNIVKAVAGYNNEMFVAGEFTQYGHLKPLHYLGKIVEVTDIADVNNNINFTVYPNPADRYLTINISADQPFKQIVISDITGRELIKHAGNDLSNTVLVEDLLPGVYVIRVLTANGTGTARFVKQ